MSTISKYNVAKREAFARAQATQSVHRAFFDLIPDRSNGDSLLRKAKRQMRELVQRECAAKRERILWKSKSKRERKEYLEKQRAEKYAQFDAMFGDEPIFQAGFVSTAVSASLAVAAGTVAVAIKKFTGKLGSKVDALSESVEKFVDSSSRASNAIGTTFEGVNGFFRTLFDALTAFVNVVKSVGGAVWKLIVGGFALAIKLCGSFASAIQDIVLGLLRKIVPGMQEVEPDEEILPQSGFALPAVAAMVTTFVLPLTAAKDKKAALTGAVLARVSTFDRMVSGFESIFSFILELTQKCLNAVLRMVGAKEVTLVGHVQKGVLDWCREVDATLQKIDCDRPTISELQKARSILNAGYNLKATLQAAHLRSVIDRQLDKLSARIASHRGILETENCYRAPPILVMFGGESAVGKTALIKHFASAVLILSGLCKPEETAQNMWQKGEDRFFNGYCGQLVYIMDDVFQKKAVKGSDECEGMTIIRAVNNWAFPLPFADVESKGRFTFSSKLMIGTTNQRNIKSDLDAVLAKPEAVLRRFDHSYWIEVAPEYLTERGTFNHGKFQRVWKDNMSRIMHADNDWTEDDAVNCVPWEAWNLKTCIFDGSELKGDGPSMFALVKAVAADLVTRKEYHDDSVSTLNDWLQAIGAAREDRISRQSGLDMSGPSDFPVWQHSEEDEISSDSESDGPGAPESIPDTEVWASDSFGRKRKIDNETTAEHVNRLVKEHMSLRKAIIDRLHGIIAEMGVHVKCVYARARSGDIIASVSLIGYCLTAVQLLGKVWKFISGVVRGIKELVCGHRSGSDGDEPEAQSVHQVNYPQKKSATISPPSAISQIGNPPTDHLNDIVYRNTWKIMSDGISVGQAIMLRGNIAVIPYHFHEQMSRCDNIEMISVAASGARVKFSGDVFASFEHHDIPSADLSFVDFSSVHTRAHRDLVGYIVTDREVCKELARGADIPVRLDVARSFEVNGVTQVERISYVSRGVHYQPTVSVAGTDVRQCWKYNVPTQAGDCGAPFTIAEPRYFNGHCLLGLHIAGRTRVPGNGMQREGYAAVLTKEMVEAQLAKFSKRPIVDKFKESLEAQSGIVIEEGSFDVIEQCGLARGSMAAIGYVPEGARISQSTKTKLMPTGFTGFGECPVKPAILHAVERDGEVIHPMNKAMEGYQSPLHNSFVKNPEAIMGLAMKKHWELTFESPGYILDLVDAIIGIPHMKLKSLNRQSSCGYSLNLRYRNGKLEIFGNGDEFDLCTLGAEEVKALVLAIIEAAKRGERWAHIFVDFLKDETRPEAKVEAVATRAISGAPLAYIIAVRMYFGAFMSSVFMNHTLCGMAPGINYYTEWDKLALELLRPGGRVFAGDFKSFDASEQPEIHTYILDYINKWYRHKGGSEEDDLVRRVLYEDLVHSRHLTGIGAMRDTLVQWNKSLPSGHPLTTIVNSMYALFTITACYVKRTGDYSNMWSNAYICTYGDDNVVGVSDAVSEVFNQVTVAEDMKMFALTYTSDRKDGELQPYVSIDEITFLKRSFRRAENEGGWCAPLDMNSILYRMYWYHNKRSFARDFQQNAREVLLELSLHDESEWQQRFDVLTGYLRDSGMVCDISSRTQARQLAFLRNDVWY